MASSILDSDLLAPPPSRHIARADGAKALNPKPTARHGQDDAMNLADRLAPLGLTVPAAPAMPSSVVTTFSWVRIVGQRVLISGHGPLNPDGSPAGPFGRVPDQVALEQAQHSARLAAASVVANLERAIGDLDQVAAWVSVAGYVQAEPGYPSTTAVLNSFSEVVHAVFGPVVGDHARTAVGVAALPLNLPLVVAAELQLAAP